MTRAADRTRTGARTTGWMTTRVMPIAAILFLSLTACIGDAPKVRSNSDGGGGTGASGGATGTAGRDGGVAASGGVAGTAGPTDGGPDSGASGAPGGSPGGGAGGRGGVGTAVQGGAGGSAGLAGGPGTGGGGSGGATGGRGMGTAGQGGGGGGTASVACDKTKAFGKPELIPGLNNSTMRTEFGRLSSDGLTIYFDALRDGGLGDYDIYRATRSSTAANFGTPTLLPNINGPVADRAPTLTSDGLTMFFESDRNSDQSDLFVATRPNTLADFGPPSTIAGLNSSGRDAIGSLTADGRTLYFSSDRVGGINSIYMATRDAGGVFGTPSLVASLNSQTDDGDPVVSADNLTMYFSSHRTTTGSAGRADVLIAHRSAVGDSFGAPRVLTELSSAFTDFPNWISPDECTIIFSSARVRGASDYDLYWATRPK